MRMTKCRYFKVVDCFVASLLAMTMENLHEILRFLAKAQNDIFWLFWLYRLPRPLRGLAMTMEAFWLFSGLSQPLRSLAMTMETNKKRELVNFAKFP